MVNIGLRVGLRRVDEVGLHGLQNCTSMWVQFWGIIYNIILYYYNEYLIKLHRCAILQFMQTADVARMLDGLGFLKIVHFQEGRGSGSRDA